MACTLLNEATRESATNTLRAARYGDDSAGDFHWSSPRWNAVRVCHTDAMSEESYGNSVVISAASARAATLGARIGRHHHADFTATSRSGATILVMSVVASAPRRVACRQWQTRRVRGQEALARETMDRGAGAVAWNYRDRMEFRFRRTRLVRRPPRFLQTEQLTQRPSDGHRCHRIRAGRNCIRREATTLFLRRGRTQSLGRA